MVVIQNGKSTRLVHRCSSLGLSSEGIILSMCTQVIIGNYSQRSAYKMFLLQCMNDCWFATDASKRIKMESDVRVYSKCQGGVASVLIESILVRFFFVISLLGVILRDLLEHKGNLPAVFHDFGNVASIDCIKQTLSSGRTGRSRGADDLEQSSIVDIFACGRVITMNMRPFAESRECITFCLSK